MAKRGRPRKQPAVVKNYRPDVQDTLVGRIHECETVLEHITTCPSWAVITRDLERMKAEVDARWHEIADPLKLQEWRIQKFAYVYLTSLKEQYAEDLKNAKIELDKLNNPGKEIPKDYDPL